MKMIKRTLIILIIATTIFTVVKCNRIEDVDNIKQEQGDDTLPKEDTNKKDEQNKEEENKDNQDKEKQDKDDEPKEDQEKEEIKSPVELG